MDKTRASEVRFLIERIMTNHFDFRILTTQKEFKQADVLLEHQIGSERHQKAHFNWDPLKLAVLRQKPGMIFWGGYQGDQLIVFICVQNLSSDQYEIQLVLTHENSRRTQAATLAIESFVRKQCKNGDVLWLEVHTENIAAVKFYEKLGFKIDGYRKNYYIDGGQAINMSRKLVSPN